MINPKICMVLDADGVLNQYDYNERIKRHKKLSYGDIFNPFPKKVKRLSKIIKKYNIDVYVFSAWTKEQLEEFVDFNIVEDLRKDIDRVNEIMQDDYYDFCYFIDDEASVYKEVLNKDIRVVQPNYKYGICKKDIIKIKRFIKQDLDL